MPTDEKLPQFAPSLVRFDTWVELRIYVKRMGDYYQQQVDRYGERAGELMREILRRDAEKKRDRERKKPQVWDRVGSILIDTSDELLAKNELTLQLLEEYKFKLAACMDTLKSLKDTDQYLIPEDGRLLLYLRDGIPERVVVEPGEKGSSVSVHPVGGTNPK